MENEKVTLRLKSKWKWFIYITQFTALCLLVYLLVNLWAVTGFNSPESIFLNIFFGVSIFGNIYFMVYASKHKVYFYSDRLTKAGVFTKRTRKYKDLSEVWLSTKIWDMKSPVAIISDSGTLVFDYRYENQEDVAEFLTKMKSIPSLPRLYFDSKSLNAQKDNA